MQCIMKLTRTVCFCSPNIPREYMSKKGAVLVFSVSDHDTLVNDDFAGEVIVQLSLVEKLRMSETIDCKPVVMMALKRAQTQSHGPYKVGT